MTTENSGSGGTTNELPDPLEEMFQRDYDRHKAQRLLPCLECGRTFEPAAPLAIGETLPAGFTQQPSEGTAFYTYGHYGSTFWDSFNGEQCVIVVCDACLRAAPPERIAYIKQVRQHPAKWAEFDPNVASHPVEETTER